jgi:hypothetical protein
MVKTHDLEYFVDKIQSTQDKLNRAFYFLKWASDNPKLFFTDSNTQLTSKINTFHFIFEAIDYEAESGEGYPSNSLREYIGYKMNNYFQSWLKENNITNEYNLKVVWDYGRRYFIIKTDNNLIGRFNISNKKYSLRKYLTEDELEVKKIEDIMKLKEEIRRLENKIAEKNTQWKHIYKEIKSLSDLYSAIFKRKTLYKGYTKIIEKIENQIKYTKESIDKLNDGFTESLKRNNEIEDGVKIAERIFKEFDYEKNTEVIW